jgi:hypothetical protein
MFPWHCSVNHEGILAKIDHSDVYIHYVGAFSTSWETHLVLLDTICCHLKDNDGMSKKLTGLVIGSLHVASNLGKRKLIQSCTWTIHAPQLTFTASSVVSTDMWPSCAHVLKPLTDWTPPQLDWHHATCICQNEIVNGSRCSDCLPWSQ